MAVEKTDSATKSDIAPRPASVDDLEFAPYKPREEVDTKQDPFSGEEHGQVKYKTMRWWHCSFLMIAESISLGVLSLPSSMATLGIVPAAILIVGFGILTTYSGCVMSDFKLRHPHVQSMADAGEVLFGAWGREIIGATQVMFLICLMGAHVLTFSVMMNTLTEHAACTIIFCFLGAAVSFILSLPRTFHKVSYLAIVSCASILVASLTTMIAVGVEKPDPHAHALEDPTLVSGFSAALNIVLSLSGHIAFFSFQSELADPREFPKAIYLLQTALVVFYLIVSLVIYRYGGAAVRSPAFLSASPILAKVSFGLAVGTIVIAGVILGHVGCKYIYVRIFRGTGRMHENSLVSLGTWVSIVLVGWILAWIIAEAIPVFNDLLNFLAAVFTSWFSFGIGGMLWFSLNKGSLFSSPKNITLAAVNGLIVLLCLLMFGMGLWTTGTNLHKSAQHAHGSFSCANNA